MVCQHFEMSDFRSVIDMRSDTRANVIISDADNTQCVACVFRQLAKIDDLLGFRFRYKFDCNRQMPVDHLIYPAFHLCHYFGCRFFRQLVVTFTLFPFYMCILRTRATEHTDHRLIQDMFCRMHRRIFGFVVLV